ncbi:MAG TPA: hypothetical protein RMH85_12765 [Polyangiaceae bacterium LLY-WYZ-15_(1-7)]|nr:hypothetical protein [Myxococcales bacterium]MAT25516.1 hypothetical protein [Sandaracinus sp.]HJK95459.1 hypothetical protein [Polyangiaceae bacterium LLY-WYZ-15_(1-7)]MBJ72093.1 hypothetical protein [Sandaracinus sp.]HJL00367.1 hypothetical protein [Polyangiaceae bacterium LLY-WYZ-15_(1-7)]
MRSLLLSFAALSLLLACDDSRGGGGYVGTPLAEHERSERLRAPEGQSSAGTARMPNLPVKLDPSREPPPPALGSGAGGRREPNERVQRGRERLEQMSHEQALGLVRQMAQAMLATDDEDPCDRVRAMAGVLSEEGGEELDEEMEEELRERCSEVPSELLACLRDRENQSPREQRRCERILGTDDPFASVFSGPGGGAPPGGGLGGASGAGGGPRRVEGPVRLDDLR